MNRYDYYKVVREDLEDFLKEEVSFNAIASADEFEEMQDDLYDKAFIQDSVTGNASGSYFFNAFNAEEALCHNYDLLMEACDEFGDDVGEILKRGAEIADSVIRCYVLGRIFDKTFHELKNEMFD